LQPPQSRKLNSFPHRQQLIDNNAWTTTRGQQFMGNNSPQTAVADEISSNRHARKKFGHDGSVKSK
jgi:hypothetical protein